MQDGAADDQIGFAQADAVADGHTELIEESRFEEKHRSGLLAQGGPSPGRPGVDLAVKRKLSAEQAQLHEPCFARREGHHGGEVRFVISGGAFGREGGEGSFVEREAGGNLQVTAEQFAGLQGNALLEAGPQRVDRNEGGDAYDNRGGKDGETLPLAP